jgi:chromosome segregation ATPase
VNTGPGSQLHTMFEKWTAAAGKLEKLGERLRSSQEELDELGRLQEQLTTRITEFGEKINHLLEELRKERQVSRDEAQAHLEMAHGVVQATQTLGNSLRDLNDRAEQFKEIVNRLDDIVEQLDDDRYR